MRCEVCQQVGTMQWRPGTEVAVGTVAGVLDRRPEVVCPAGHASSPASGSLAAWDAIEERLDLARARRLRGDVCRHCGESLTLPVRRTRRSVTIADPELAVHTLHLDVPMVRCGGCGRDQVPSRSQHDLSALAAAVYAAPPGAAEG
jgi:hypothetical protein